MEDLRDSQIERVGKIFLDHIKKIQKRRVELGIDKKKKSISVLTNLIVKHNSFNLVLEDLLNYKFREC